MLYKPIFASLCPCAAVLLDLALPPPPPLQAGWTPLHVAAYHGHVPLVALLLSTPGLDPDMRDEVRSAQRRVRGPPA